MNSPLIKNLKSLQADGPYIVQEPEPGQITISINLVDAKWYTVLQQNNMKKAFVITVTHDDSTKVAKISSTEYQLEWQGGVPRLGAQLSTFQGQQFGIETETRVGLTPDRGIGKVVDYTLNSGAMVSKVKSIVKESGYQIQYSKQSKTGLIFGLIGIGIALLVTAIVVVVAILNK